MPHPIGQSFGLSLKREPFLEYERRIADVDDRRSARIAHGLREVPDAGMAQRLSGLPLLFEELDFTVDGRLLGAARGLVVSGIGAGVPIKPLNP